jgi:hypothetical protein
MRTANKPAATAATIAAHPTAAQQQQLEASELQQLRDRLQLHNTMSRKKEHVKPRSDMGDRLQMYVCGVTVYDFSHIGEGVLGGGVLINVHHLLELPSRPVALPL